MDGEEVVSDKWKMFELQKKALLRSLIDVKPTTMTINGMVVVGADVIRELEERMRSFSYLQQLAKLLFDGIPLTSSPTHV